MLQLIDQILSRAEQGQPVALCAIVRTRGSTPQGTGAAMVILENGHSIGTLGGGCVEAEVRKRALEMIQARQNRLLTFRLDHDFGWDDGLVCGGVMDVAIQVYDSPAAGALLKPVRDSVLARRKTELEMTIVDEKGVEEKFTLPIVAGETLLIAGAGHVGQALAQLSRELDFALTVIDDRPDFATAERFPSAACIVGDIETELKKFPIDKQTYVVIVTRGHRHDAQALEAVIGRSARYVGLIGSRRKVHTIFSDLHNRGISREALAAVHAPIGLEIGAITPQEIAVSIMAELIAVRRGKGDQAVLPMKVRDEQLDKFLRKSDAGGAST